MRESLVAALLLGFHNLALATLLGGLAVSVFGCRTSAVETVRSQEPKLVIRNALERPFFYIALLLLLGFTGALLPVLHKWSTGSFHRQSSISGAALALKVGAIVWMVTLLMKWQKDVVPVLKACRRQMGDSGAEISATMRSALEIRERCVSRCLAAAAVVLFVTPFIVYFQK